MALKARTAGCSRGSRRRERVSAELALIEYAEGIHAALQAQGYSAGADAHRH